MRLFRRTLVLCAGLVAMSCTQVTVEKLPVEPDVGPVSCLRGWGLSPASAALFLGDSTRFSLVPNCDRVPAAVRWFSGNSAIAEVDSITGWIRGKALGQITITAADVADRNVRTAAVLQVVARP